MYKIKARTIKRYWPYGLLLAVLILFYWDMVWARGAWLVADHAEQHFPWAFHLAQNLKHFRIPFWTDLIHTGFPITAEGQIGSFYLPNILFYTLFPIRQGYAWNIIFHLIVSAAAMCAYLRSLGLDNRSAFFATLVYLFGSTLGGAYYNITSLKVLTWFPLTLMLCDRILQSRRLEWRSVAALGFLFSLQLLAGYLQFAAYAVLFTGLYLFLRFFDRPERSFSQLATLLLHYAWAVLIAAVVAMPQLLLTFELAVRSNRASPEEGFAYVGSYSPFALVCLLFPSLEGFFVSKLYLGIVPLFFIIASFYGFWRSKHRAIYFLVLVALLLALGQWSPLYVGLVKIFHFHSFRTPVKFIFFAGFFLCVLAAFGMQAVLKDKKGQRTAKAARVYTLFLAGFVLAVLLAYFAFHKFDQALYSLGEKMVKNLIYGQPGHPYGWEHYEARLAGVITFAQEVLNPRNSVIWVPVLKMLAAVAVIAVFLKGRIRAAVFYIGMTLLLIADLNFTYSDIRGDYQDYDAFFKKSGIVRFLEDNLKDDVYFVYATDPSNSPLPASKNMIWGLASANAYSPLVSKDYYEFMGALGGVNDSVGYHPVDNAFMLSQLKILGMLHVRYILSDQDLEHPELKPVFEEGGWRIYEMAKSQERYFLVEKIETSASFEESTARVRSPDFDPALLAVVEADRLEFAGQPGEGTLPAGIRVVSDYPGYKILKVSAAQDGLCVIVNLWYPGWEAQVDEAQAPLYRVNGILMGVPVKRGDHRIILRYTPLSKDKA